MLLRRAAISRKTAAKGYRLRHIGALGSAGDREISPSRNHAGLYAGPAKVDPDCDFRVHKGWFSDVAIRDDPQTFQRQVG